MSITTSWEKATPYEYRGWLKKIWAVLMNGSINKAKKVAQTKAEREKKTESGLQRKSDRIISNTTLNVISISPKVPARENGLTTRDKSCRGGGEKNILLWKKKNPKRLISMCREQWWGGGVWRGPLPPNHKTASASWGGGKRGDYKQKEKGEDDTPVPARHPDRKKGGQRASLRGESVSQCN